MSSELEQKWGAVIRKARMDDILWHLVSRKGFVDLYRRMEKEGDKQSAELLRDVSDKLDDALKLTSGQQEALSRLIGCVDNRKKWNAPLLRNNIFKAANSLGMRLPSAFFASKLAYRKRTLKKDLKLRTGDVIPRGTEVDVLFLGPRHRFGDSLCHLKAEWTGSSGRDYTKKPLLVKIDTLERKVTGFKRPPSTMSLMKMMDNGITTTPTGKRVEPDGYGPDGSPSWMLVLGFI